MVKIEVILSEPEAAALRELAEQSGISIQEAAARAIRYVVTEVLPVQRDFYLALRSRLFWEHYRHLQSVLRHQTLRQSEEEVF